MWAQDALDPTEAAGLLCEMIAYAISEIGVAARARLVENPGDRSAQERDAYCQNNMLPALLRNQLLRDQHFIRTRNGGDGVITRLVEQLTEGRPAGADDDRQHLFTPQDLEFDQIERDGLGLAEKRAVGQLDREDRRQVATAILNTALDDAKRRLLALPSQQKPANLLFGAPIMNNQVGLSYMKEVWASSGPARMP